MKGGRGKGGKRRKKKEKKRDVHSFVGRPRRRRAGDGDPMKPSRGYKAERRGEGGREKKEKKKKGPFYFSSIPHECRRMIVFGCRLEKRRRRGKKRKKNGDDSCNTVLSIILPYPHAHPDHADDNEEGERKKGKGERKGLVQPRPSRRISAHAHEPRFLLVSKEEGGKKKKTKEDALFCYSDFQYYPSRICRSCHSRHEPPAVVAMKGERGKGKKSVGGPDLAPR